MLEEQDPTRTMEIKGQQVPTKRYQLYWSGLGRYEPKTAEELARLRASRKHGKTAREDKRWAAANPLLAWMERQQRQGQGRDSDSPAR
jgi:hypothetical protein